MFMSRNVRFVLVIIAGTIALGTGWRLWSLRASGELWGYLPLWFFLALLGLKILFGIDQSYAREPVRFRWLFLALLSGALLSAGFPPGRFSFLLFGAMVPFLLLEREVSQSLPARSGKELFQYLWTGFMFWNILTTFWVANSALVAGIFAVTVNSFLMTLPFLAYQQTKKYQPGWLGRLSIIPYWIAFEYFHMRWELSWPWLTLGNGFASLPSWVQWYEYTGVLGGTLWIWLINFLIFDIWNQSKTGSQKTAFVPGAVGLILVILLPLALSLNRYYSWSEQGEQREVAVIQPNFEPHYEKMNTPAHRQLERYLTLSEQIVDGKTDYLVFPETVFGLIQNQDLGKERLTAPLKKFTDQHPGLKLVSGFSTYDKLEPVKGKPLPRTARMDVFNNGKDTIFWQAYNAAAQFTAGQDEVPVYFKSKLVPGAEHFPFYDLLFMFQFIVDQLDGTIEGNATQVHREAFKAADGMGVGPVICYESIYGEFVTGYIRAGANALFILTNDGWWDNTPGHVQHVQFASLRAIETRRAIARSANSGISAFINQRGDIQQPTAYGEQAAISQSIYFNNALTFYVIWGDLIGRVALFLTLMLAFVSLRQRLLKNKIINKNKS